jgi:hypothetical protein
VNTRNDRGDDEQQRRLDLLVDGELGEAERRELLEQLGGQPDGWRRCAMAFLEAQCWKDELGLSAGGSREPAATPTAAGGSSQGRRWGWAATLLAMAASFLVAFSLGSLWRADPTDGRRRAAPGIPSPGAVARHEPSPPAPRRAVAEWPSLPAAQPGAPGPITAVTLSVPVGDDGRCESIELPVVERDRVDDGWLGELPAAMPPELLRALERAGHRVRQRREMLRLELPDGRPLIVPVDRVDVDYAGGPPL